MEKSETSTDVERLKLIGELSGGVLHDVNNQLMVILGSCEILASSSLSLKEKEYINKIKRSALSSASLIRKILSFSHREEELDLIKIINEIKDIVLFMTEKNGTIFFNSNLDTAIISSNDSSIENAIINLIKNGIEASNDNFRIDVVLELVTITKPIDNSIVNGDLTGEFYKLEVIDYGMGISDSIKDKIFNPFFSTKQTNKGVGLGLSTILNTITSYKGYITLDSEFGKGSKFTLFLPKS